MRMRLIEFNMTIPNPGTAKSVEEAAQRAVNEMVPAGVVASVRVERELPGWVQVVVRLRHSWWRFWS